MSKITFNKEAIEALKKNQYVIKVSEKSITYSDKFKRLFIEEYLSGKIFLKKMTPIKYRNHLYTSFITFFTVSLT